MLGKLNGLLLWMLFFGRWPCVSSLFVLIGVVNGLILGMLVVK